MDCKKVGGFICTLRKGKGLTQAVLAEKLGISNRTVSKWENGDGMPDVSILTELAEILGVTVDELLKGEKAETELPQIKVTEVSSKSNINNVFQMMFVISLFFDIFGAILGGVTELYSIWAFRTLFYTHWEIIFVAVSFTAIVVSALTFTLAVTRLQISYTKDEILHKAGKKALIIALIATIFPITFVLRILDVFMYGSTPNICIALVAIIAVLFAVLYRKIKNAWK